MKKKILIWGMSDFPGGIESVITNYLSNFNLDRFQFDFIISGFKKIAYAERIEKMGSRVFYFPKKRKNPYKYYRELKKFFKNTGNKYDAIWFNSNDLANIDCLKLAKKVGIKTRIIHSHNSRITGTGLNAIRKKVFHQINKQNIVNIATDYWACSTVAANWMYPKNVRVKIIKNAISQKKFEFSNKKRKKLIKKYSLQNSVIIGNVGRLYFQKNQFFTYEFYSKVDCLVFMSKLETWGMPITEFKQTGKAIICADLPYAHETVDKYKSLSFVNPNNYASLAEEMRQIINHRSFLYKNDE